MRNEGGTRVRVRARTVALGKSRVGIGSEWCAVASASHPADRHRRAGVSSRGIAVYASMKRLFRVAIAAPRCRFAPVMAFCKISVMRAQMI